MSFLLAAGLALAADTPKECDSAWLFLRYLAKHQVKDGSWGGRPAECACPEPPELPAPTAQAPADPQKTAALIRALGDDDPEKRDDAERDLRALDLAALPALREAAGHADPEVRGRCERLRNDIAIRIRGAGDPETTGLALLSFLGAGYSHLSKDGYDGFCYGDVVRKGLRWLAGRMDANGRFDAKDAVANAVAALALSEAFGMTGSNLWKEDAQRGVTGVMQADVKEPRELAWKAMVVVSALRSDLLGPSAEQYAAIAEALKETPTLFAKAALSYFRFVVAEKNNGVAAAVAVAATTPKDLDAETRYVAAAALYMHDGPKGARWKAWSPDVKEAIVPLQVTRRDRCERGSWEGETLRGRLRTTALSGLALEVYYRYANVFGAYR